MGRGRPSGYSQEIGDRICDLISSGETDSSIETIEDMPCAQTIRRWRLAHEEFSSNYARAREARADFRSDRIDQYVKQVLSGDLKPDAARVAIDAEKWQAGKEKPKVYGDRSTTDINQTVTINVAFEDYIRSLNEASEAKVINGTVATEGRRVESLPAPVRNRGSEGNS